MDERKPALFYGIQEIGNVVDMAGDHVYAFRRFEARFGARILLEGVQLSDVHMAAR